MQANLYCLLLINHQYHSSNVAQYISDILTVVNQLFDYNLAFIKPFQCEAK